MDSVPNKVSIYLSKHSVNRARSKTKRDRRNEFALFSSYVNVFQFQLNRNVFHRYDDEFFFRNLESSVDNGPNGASHHEGFAIYIIVPGHNKCSPFSFFFGPSFLRDFVPGIFSLFDEFIT